ncbi:PAS domain-containing sensor histidine kinase [bacterium]|nr:MAG: PAS domain-containing sensor histidine kinase [bacterium]
MNSSFHVIDMNKIAHQVLGVSPEQLRDKSITDVYKIHDSDKREVSVEEIYQNYQSGNGTDGNFRFTLLEDEYDEVIVHLNFVAVEKENVIEKDAFVFLAIKNVTSEFESHLELKKREEQFRLIFENSPAGICFYDLEGTIIQVNDEFSFILGSSRERLVGLNMIRDLKNKEVITQVQKSLEKKLGFYEGYYSSVSSNKTTFVRCFFNPVLGDRNEFIGGVCLLNDLTEAQRDKKRIEYLYANLNALVESSQDYVFAIDRDGNYLYFNSKHVELFKQIGGVESINLGDNVFDFLPKNEDVELSKKRLREIFDGKSLHYKRSILLDNKLRHFTVSMNPVTTQEDEIIAVSIFMRDITKEHEANTRIKLNEQLLNSVTSNLTEAVYRSSKEDGIIYANDAFYSMFGYSKEEAINDKELYLFYENPGSRTSFLNEIDENLKVSNREMQLKRKDGSRFWALLNVSKIRADEKDYYDGVITDITERKRNDTQIKESEESYKKLFENASEPIYIIDESYSFVDLNAAACKMYGATNAELIGKKPPFATDLELNNPILIKDMLKKAFKGVPQNNVIYGKRITGEIFPQKLRLQKSTYFGKTVLIAFVEDITQIKKQEDERNRMIQDLTRQNRDLQHFSYVISHDLRAPVANILSLTSIFEMADLDAVTQNKIINGLQQSASILDKTIRDLNEVLSVRNDIHAQKEFIKFSDIMLSVQTGLTRQIMQSNAQITYNFDEVDGMFSIQAYLNSIFFNLVSNAIKYRSPERTPEIHVVSRRKLGKIEIEFHDNGLGLDLEKFSKKLFDIYQRFHTHVEGRGLGLYLVKTQVESLSGTIEVKSKLGLGSVFTVIFAHD